MSGTRNVETKNRSHDAVETCGEALKRSAKEGTTVPCTRKKQSPFGSTCGQRLGRTDRQVQQNTWTKKWKCCTDLINNELMEIEADQKYVP